jgi:FkbM family methyltransferase
MTIFKSSDSFTIDMFKDSDLSIYYDIGAYPDTRTVSLFNELLQLNVSIFAFDPHQESYDKLISIFGNKINSYKLGVSNKTEQLKLYNVKEMCGFSTFVNVFKVRNEFTTRFFPDLNNVNSYEVQTVQLDKFIKQYSLPVPDVIKIDVEDWEVKTIDSIPFEIYKPILIVECHREKTLVQVSDKLKHIYNRVQYKHHNSYNKIRSYYVFVPRKDI